MLVEIYVLGRTKSQILDNIFLGSLLPSNVQYYLFSEYIFSSCWIIELLFLNHAWFEMVPKAANGSNCG